MDRLEAKSSATFVYPVPLRQLGAIPDGLSAGCTGRSRHSGKVFFIHLPVCHPYI